MVSYVRKTIRFSIAFSRKEFHLKAFEKKKFFSFVVLPFKIPFALQTKKQKQQQHIIILPTGDYVVITGSVEYGSFKKRGRNSVQWLMSDLRH